MPDNLALYTFGVFVAPADDAANDGFHTLNDPILDLVDTAPGLVARSGYDGDPGPASWGTQVYPPFYKERGDDWSPSTLSLWSDLESALAFSYFGLHARALKRGREWFRKPQWPPYVAWWCSQNHIPDWREAVSKHTLLHARGSTAEAFDFKRPYDASGQLLKIDRAKVRSIADGVKVC